VSAEARVQIELVPLNGAPFTIHYADYLAEFFFRANASSCGPNAYDDCVLAGDNPDRITTDDIAAVNRTMAARTPHKCWAAFTEATADEPWLIALSSDWDLYAMPEPEWLEHVVHKHLGTAFEKVMGPYRGPAVATKVLHIKRPRLIPVCDSYVARTMGMTYGDEVSWRDLLRLVMHLRKQGQANLEALLEIHARLSAIGIERTLVRILDALLWMRGNERGEYFVFEQWLHEVYG
jgi:hypothetical protein